ncbi:MAG: ATP-grasp domain-containing protein [Spirochaetales bacterium]|nr:ATP-grasp domain-containing protein [Spirochaetales bacterium]
MKRNIVICEYISTGVNYIGDVKARGYNPILLDGTYVGTPEELRLWRDIRDLVKSKLGNDITIIPETSDYNELLEKVRSYDPLIVIPGNEFGVELATRLGSDLGLKGNSADRIKAMTEKDSMHQALKDHGLRYIRGKVVTSEQEAISWYDELGVEDVVVKRVRGAGTQGVYLCSGRQETLDAVRKSFSDSVASGSRDVAIMIQERIKGTEYIVNTVSCNGKHRVNSIWVYDKIRLANGTNAYNYSACVPRLNVGHSRLIRYALQVADAIGVKYGPIHGEYMIDEKGPVLIEVNCRPMGGALQRKYIEQIFGHHETDACLDSYLDPEKFEEDARKPYRVNKMGAFKDLIITKDTAYISAPILQIATHLKSYYSSAFNRLGRTDVLSQTRNLETSGGTIYLLHEDERQVRDDLELLHLIESKYPLLLLQEEERTGQDCEVKSASIEAIMENAGCRGATLVFSDTRKSVRGAVTVDSETITDAYDSFEQGILDLSRHESFSDLESIIQQIYVFASKIRKGGRILIPESTYCNLPYGIEGMELLMQIAGLRIELPLRGETDLLAGSIS